MNSFEDLAENIRVLLQIKLVMEIKSEKCQNLSDLAQKRSEDVTRVWRDICRKAGQPVCTIPAEIVVTRTANRTG